MKITQSLFVAGALALSFGATAVNAQNVGIGVTNPASKLTVDGNLAIGADYNAAAPANGAIIEGNVGIGTKSPTQATLVVAGGANASVQAGEFFDAFAGPNLQGSGAYTEPFSIYTAEGIGIQGDVDTAGNVRAVTGFTLASDIRLKNVIGRSNSEADLQTLEKLHVTDYTMKETRFAERKFKKLIAQEVEQVYPLAVTKITDAVPDIDSIGEITRTSDGLCEINVDKGFNLKSGDRVKVFGADRLPQVVIAENVNGKSFSAQLKGIKEGSKVFVYGHEVNDLRALDYDAISMLNVSATQELAKRSVAQAEHIAALEAEVKELQGQSHELTDLRNENAKLKTETSELAARLEALEKTVVRAGSQPGEVHPVALNQ
jgi:Chaperone of endosialidase